VTALTVIAGIITYLCVGAWMWGYWCARLAGEFNIKNNILNGDGREPSWYHDMPQPWVAAMCWPIYVFFIVFLRRLLKGLAAHGESRGHKNYKARQIRIKLEEKIRIEQDLIEREVEEEVEAAVRGDARRLVR